MITLPRIPTRAAGPKATRTRTLPPLTPGQLSASITLALVALLAGWMCLHLLFLGSFAAARHQSALYNQFRSDLASALAPVGPVTAPGAPVALLEVPKLQMSQVVVEGTASGDMLFAPGHRRDTVLPGQVGISVVYGRAATNGAPFAALNTLIVGDVINVTMGQGVVTYEVIGVRRAGDPIPQPPTGTESRLTLVTAEGDGRYASIAPKNVIYVDAQASEGFPAPAGLPTGLPDSERVMASQWTALPVLVLCLAGLISLAALTAYFSQRVRADVIWVLATPVLVTALWFTTDTVLRLLPNLI